MSDFSPPPIYDQWWKEIATCENLPLPVALTKTVKWVILNAHTFRLGLQYERMYGFTDTEHTTIYLAMASQLEPEVVKHEMAHMLDYFAGNDEGEDYHPPDIFENCGLHRFHK